jgi:2-succinyl-5-enolpyruvyl-6-hydroxy-3-cyclohexene-1-carboxylate synthase
VPLVVLTADRPPELRGTGANQTIDQIGLYGGAVRLFAEVGAPGERGGDNAYWRSLACRALAAATGDVATAPGPVQLNVALREPLVPDDDPAWVEPLDGRADGGPWTRRSPAGAPTAVGDDLPPRTLVVLGDSGMDEAAAALALAEARGWPVVAEPSAGTRDSPCVLDAGELLVGAPGFLGAHRPERVLVVGRPTLSRAVGRLIASCPADVVATGGSWPDASRSVDRVLPAVPAAAGEVDAGWLQAWQAVAAAVRAAVDGVLAGTDGLSEPVAAGTVLDAAPSLLVVGSSKPVRDLYLAGRHAVPVLANRGVAGIDGMVSTAVGAALAHQAVGGGHVVALLGDLTFLHDGNGLVLGPDEPRPDLTVVVVNNDGGAIFGTLEQGGGSYAGAFERVFGTPHGVDLAAACAATGTSFARVSRRDELGAALSPGRGIRVVEVRTDRGAAVALDRRLRAAVAEVVGP